MEHNHILLFPQTLATTLPTIWNSIIDCSDSAVFMQCQQKGKTKKNIPYFKMGMFRQCSKVLSKHILLCSLTDQHAKLASFVVLHYSQFQPQQFQRKCLKLSSSQLPMKKLFWWEVRHFQLRQVSSSKVADWSDFSNIQKRCSQFPRSEEW